MSNHQSPLREELKNMTTYQELKTKYSNNINLIMEEQKVFWAFSQKQLEEGKEKIGVKDNSQLISIGMGGFCPRANANELSRLMKIEDARYQKELKEAKEAKEQAILYELNNHECFYRGNGLEDVISIFSGVYTSNDVMAVFKKYSKRNNTDYANE